MITNTFIFEIKERNRFVNALSVKLQLVGSYTGDILFERWTKTGVNGFLLSVFVFDAFFFTCCLSHCLTVRKVPTVHDSKHM